MKKKIFRLITLVILGTGAFLFWRHFFAPDPGPMEALTLYGNVEIRQVDLGFRVGGRLQEVLKEEGSHVDAGEELARLDPVPFRQELELAEANLAAQAATLARTQAGYRSEEVEQARAVLQERQATVNNAAQTLDRVRILRRSGGVSQQSLDDAQGRYDEAVARLEAARKQANLVETGSRPEDIAAQTALLDAARVRVAMAGTALDDTVLKAPEGGVVLTRAHETGAVIQPGQTVYSLTLSDPVHIRAYVAQPNLGLVRPGMDVRIRVDAMPDSVYHGTIGYVSPRAEFTPKTVETREVRNDLVFRVRVIAEDPDNVMRQGMPVTVTLPTFRSASTEGTGVGP